MRKLADIGFFESLNGCSNNAVSDISVFNKRMWVVNVRLGKLFNRLGEDDEWIYDRKERAKKAKKNGLGKEAYYDTDRYISDMLRDVDRREIAKNNQMQKNAARDLRRSLGVAKRPAGKYTDAEWKKMIKDKKSAIAEAARDAIWKNYSDIVSYDYHLANPQGGPISLAADNSSILGEDFDLNNISRNYNNPNDPNEQEVEYLPDVKKARTYDDLLGLYRRFKADNKSTKTLKKTGCDLGLSDELIEKLALPNNDDELTGKQIKDFIEKVSDLPYLKRILGINNPIRRIIASGIY